jgi:hypothetical protein
VAFVMKVQDVFPLTGRTVLVGEVNGSPKIIRACDCELVIAGSSPASFRIDGEDLLCPIPPDRVWRAISTSDAVDVDLVRRSLGNCEVRAIE